MQIKAGRVVILAVAVLLLLPLAGGAQQAPAQPPGKLAAPPAAPKLPDYSQEPFVIEQYLTKSRWEEDGTGKSESTLRVKVQSDAGVGQLGELQMGYNSANQKLNIDFVRVKKADGSTVTASADAVKDLSAPISREAPMYTDFRQKNISVPGLRPGDTLEYKFTLITDPPLAPGHFWQNHEFEKNAIVLDEQLEINVPRSVAVKLKTQKGAEPAISEAAEPAKPGAARKIYRWRSSNTVRLSDEEEEKRQKKERTSQQGPSVQMTSFQTWEDIGRWYAQLAADRVIATPEIKVKALELTKDKPSDIEKVKALYDFVAQNFRYVSLSFGVGRVQPHAAADVFANQYGDCKDKHTLLAAMLDSIGIPSSAVLISATRKIDEDVPSPAQFDHAITIVYLPGEADQARAQLWMDTTTEVAPFRMISANLRGKKALEVPSAGSAAGGSGPRAPRMVEAPKDPPFVSRQGVEIDGKLNDLGKLTARVKYALRGDTELLLRIAFRRTPQNKWKELAQLLAIADGFRGEILDVKASDPALTDDPFRYEFEVSQTAFFDFTRKKTEMAVPLPNLGLPPAEAEKDGEEDSAEPGKDQIELGSPLDVDLKLRLELPERYAVRLPVAIGVGRDYAEYKSSYKLEKNVLSASRMVQFKSREISASRRNDYRAFTRAVRNDESQSLQMETTVAGAPAIPENVKPDELYRTGIAALQSGNFGIAVDLLKRVAELEPKHKTVWNDLGRVYLTQRKFSDAEAAFNKQIALDPYDPYAHNNLGQVFWQEQRFDEARASFLKQIEVNPLDRFAHGNLAQMLNEQKKYADAIPEFEKALAITSESPNLQVGLGTALLNTDENDKALASFEKAVELSPSPNTWNNIAYQLSLKNVHLDRAQQYAESAVSTTAAALRNVTLETATIRELVLVSSIAAYWDTLGWVHYQRGNLDRAEEYVQASWMLTQHGEVGDHLAEIYEKRGRKEDAIQMYAQALAASRPPAHTRERLVSLAGSEKKAQDLRIAAMEKLTATRTVRLGSLMKERASAEFVLLIGSDGKADTVKFASGDERLKPYASLLKAQKSYARFPDETPVRLIRRGALSCSSAAGECIFVLMLPEDVTSVD